MVVREDCRMEGIVDQRFCDSGALTATVAMLVMALLLVKMLIG